MSWNKSMSSVHGSHLPIHFFLILDVFVFLSCDWLHKMHNSFELHIYILYVFFYYFVFKLYFFPVLIICFDLFLYCPNIFYWFFQVSFTKDFQKILVQISEMASNLKEDISDKLEYDRMCAVIDDILENCSKMLYLAEME